MVDSTGSARFGETLQLRFLDAHRPAKVQLTFVDELPGSLHGFVPSWPLVGYRFSSSERVGRVELRFYVGGITVGKNARVLEWKRTCWADVTHSFDLATGVILAQASQLSTYVVVTQLGTTLATSLAGSCLCL